MGDLRWGTVALCLAAFLGTAVASAQTPTASAAAPAQAQPGPAIQSVVVSGVRRAPGAAIGAVTPEVQLRPEEIRAYGVTRVSDLLSALAPLTTSGAGAGPPVVLLNGLRISGRGEIRDIPTEAILRIDVLPEEESLRYGYSAEQKVINIVLLPGFSATTAEISGSHPTEGGQESGTADAARFDVQGDNRINLDLRYSANSALSEEARDLEPVPTSPPYDLLGNVVAMGEEIDPALSALAGTPVTVAGVPAWLDGRAPTLEDFADTAGVAGVSDIRPYRTLQAAGHALSANSVWSRAFGERTSASLNLSARLTDSSSLRGLAGVALTVPGGDPFSPFATGVVVDRYVADALRQDNRGQSVHVGGGLNRDGDRWHLSLTGSYNRGWSRTVTDAGVDTQGVQAQLTALSGTLNPFGPLDAALFPRLAPSIASADTRSADLQAVLNGRLLDLPAGPLYSSLRIGDSGTWISSRSLSSGTLSAVRLTRNVIGVRANLDLPLTSRAEDVLPAIGDLAVSGNAAVDRSSDYGALWHWGYGVRWSPVEAFTFSVNAARDQSAPSPQQLDNPVVTATGSRLFDFATGRTVSVTSVNGGNPALLGSRQRQLRAGLTFKPFRGRRLSLVGSYVDDRVSGPIGALPPATAALQALLPDRFIRDQDGDLVMVDHRPLNFASQSHRQVRWGLNDSRPAADWLGTQEPGPLAPGAAEIVVSLYHTVVLEDRVLVRAGAPVLDLLSGGALGTRGGQARHQVDAELGCTRGAFGAHLSFAWRSGTTLLGGGAGAGDLDFTGLSTVSARLFADLGRMAIVRALPWLGGTRVTLSIANLLDRRVRVTDASGGTPASYQSAYLDPVGRLLLLSVRRQFL